jgi:hypothetical protein
MPLVIHIETLKKAQICITTELGHHMPGGYAALTKRKKAELVELRQIQLSRTDRLLARMA